MTVQRLFQQVVGTADGTGTVSLQFPPVPQGLCWTGAIVLFTPVESALVITSGVWTATRNGQPLATYGGTGILADCQLISQEKLKIVGTFLTPGTVITATWTGTSEDAHAAEIVAPKIYGALNPFSQIYTDAAAGPGSALQTVPVPAPSALQSVSVAGAGPGTATLLASSGVDRSMWSIALSASIANTSTTAAAFSCSFTVQRSDGTVLLSVEPMNVQASNSNLAESVSLWGMYLPAGQSLQMVIGAYGGTGGLRGRASVVYGPNA